MPAGVCIPQRIIADIAVPVQALRVARVRHDGVGPDKAPERGVVAPGDGVNQIARDVRIQPLTGVAIACGHCTTGTPICTKRGVAGLSHAKAH